MNDEFSEPAKNENLSALGLLAGGMAHDFNNLLTAIGVQVELAQMETKEPGAREALAQVQQAVGRGKGLTRQILAFSRQQTEERQLVRLTSIVEEVLQLLQPGWPRAIEIATQLMPEGGWILANSTQIHQVLFNLCTNAVHAMGHGPGRLEINVDMVQGGHVRLSVSDTGHGMDAITQRRIFEPFFTTKYAGGTGLGLAVVQRIVKSHGGTIQVSSSPGRGTRFEVLFALP